MSWPPSPSSFPLKVTLGGYEKGGGVSTVGGGGARSFVLSSGLFVSTERNAKYVTDFWERNSIETISEINTRDFRTLR